MDIANPYFSNFFKFAFPPLFYAVHGWIATEMAIWALFHPYEPWYVPGTTWQLPCTPGIFPKGRIKLAEAVASTITDTLLTTDDIKEQASRLITKENIEQAVDLFFDSVLKEFRDTTKLHRLATDIAELSPTLLEHLVLSIVEGLESGREQRVSRVTEKIFDQIILTTRIPLDQADEISARLMETVVTAENIRKALVSLLSPQNINAMDESIQAYSSAPYRILAKIIGVKRICYEWRGFLEKEPEQARTLIGDCLKRFGIKNQIAVQIANFDLQTLPLQSIARIRQSLVGFVESFMLSHAKDLVEAVRRIENEAMGTVRQAIIRFNPETIPKTWLVRAKTDTSAFCYSYLNSELGALMERLIPALGMYTLISTKIELFTPQELEKVIRRICKNELKWLAYLGGFIGIWLGFVQVAVNIAFYH